MPGKARIDAPGALHHVIARGIAREEVFDDNADRNFFVDRLGLIISDTSTQCLGWAFIPNHFQLRLKTGATPIATVMKRLLTGYAMHYNRRHKRHGHLFQNRYKSILCQEEAYLLELVRYIHLNPLRAKLVADMKGLDDYPYGGHSALMGTRTVAWQNTGYILGLFGDKISSARRGYRDFVEKGVADGKRPDLTGGGLIRSVGGWTAAIALRKAKALQKGDERILGDGDFIEAVLSEASEVYARKYRLKAKGIDVDTLAQRAAQIAGIEPSQVWASGKQPKVYKPAVFCAIGRRVNWEFLKHG